MGALLVDDHRLIREGLKGFLLGRGIEVVGEAGDGREAVALARALRPDLVIMDLGMPVMGGLEATRLIKTDQPETAVVILTASEAESDLFEAVKSGAQGYLLKSMDPTAMVEQIEAAGRGEPALTPRLAAKILAEFARLSTPTQPAVMSQGIAGDGAAELTAREREVLELLVAGAANKQIAHQLVVSENTVKYHLKNILQKLHLQNRAQVVAYALRHGLAGASEPEAVSSLG
ncbi:MAG: response regulator transcription factor [Chloroflexi bacterium]|nr:response regulator transcription factor [Chloroflexota bacterium]